MAWLGRDGKPIMVKKAVRSLAYGISGTMLVTYLKTIGIHELAIGILLCAALAGSIAFNLVTIRYSPRSYMRKMLIAYSILVFISLCVLLLKRAYPLMLLGAVRNY